jgi:hypothetical protein
MWVVWLKRLCEMVQCHKRQQMPYLQKTTVCMFVISFGWMCPTNPHHHHKESWQVWNWDTSMKSFSSLCWHQHSFSKLPAYCKTKSISAAMWASDVHYHLFALKSVQIQSYCMIIIAALAIITSMHMWPLNLKVFESFERYNRPQNGPSSLILCQSMWDIWWKKWHWHSVFSKHFSFHLSVSFCHVLYSRFIHLPPMYNLCN